MKPFTSLTLTFHDDGRVSLHAPDRDAEGHVWAIQNDDVSWERAKDAAHALGPAVLEGVEATLATIIKRQRDEANRLTLLAERAAEAQRMAEKLEALR